MTRARGGVRVAIRLTPRAHADRLDGILRTGAGGAALKACVTAPPADGRANEALLQLLARTWRIARRDLAIVAGLSSRSKIVHIAGDTDLLMPRLTGAIAQAGALAVPAG